MPIYNVTVEDISPMIIYSQGWMDSNSSDPRYSGTFHATNIQGATASFSFFGTAVYLFGAKRENYGPYSVTLDGQQTSGNAASSPGDEVFKQALFSQTGISSGQHTLILTNDGIGSSVDVDFIAFTTGDGNSNTQIATTAVDDTASVVVYKPEDSAWPITNNLLNKFYYNDSFHATQSLGAQAVIPFTGDAVAVFGATSTNHGMFSVQVDNRGTVQLNGFAPTFRAQVLLYWAGGLGSGQHQLQITNNDTQFVDFDFLTATSWNPSEPSPVPLSQSAAGIQTLPPSRSMSSPGSTTVPSSSASSPIQGHQSTTKTPIIAGVVSGTFVGIVCIMTLLFLLRRRRRRRHQVVPVDVSAQFKVIEPFILPSGPPNVGGDHRPGEYVFGHGSSGKGYPPRPQGVQPPSASTSSSTRPSTSVSPGTRTGERSSDNHMSTQTNLAPSSTALSSSIVADPPAVVSSRVRRSRKATMPSPESSSRSAGNILPTAQSDTQQSISAADLSMSRITVPNRPQDWGPIIPVSHHEREEVLPPDYRQATQPMPPVTTSSVQ